jgi:TolB-like protein/Flp pilus assembly protein TadD
MAASNATLQASALSPEQIALVRLHLRELKASREFANSERSKHFLELIVERTLDGKADSLHERTIGAEMFGRPIDYDTGSDAVVRVKANEVRKKLAQHYFAADRKFAVRIQLRSGSYVPRFIFEPPEPTPQPQAHLAPLSSAGQSIAPPEAPQAEKPVSPAPAPPPLPAQKFRFTPRLRAGAAIGLAVIAVIGYFGFRDWYVNSHVHSGIRSIAILPLKNLSGDPGQEYFADGMTEELINDLGLVSTLRVISLTSSMSYKGTTKKLPEIAHELAVDGVVEGGVLRDGNQVRVSTQLIDARTDRPIWAHSYVRDLTSVHAWQGEVAQAIADEISIDVTPEQQARLARSRPIDPQAQDLYLHGMLQLDADDVKSAVVYFSKSLDKNPNYAQAHAALAYCFGRLGEQGQLSYQLAFRKQKAEASRAIELDDSLPEAHAELANAAMTLDWDWSTAAAEFRRALELNPNSAAIHQKYAFYLVRTGQLAKALEEVKRGVDLDPVSGRSLHYEGFLYYFSRQYDQVLPLIRTVRALDITPADWSFLLGDVYAQRRAYSESIAEFLKSGDGPHSLGHLGNAYARAGRVAAARKTIAKLEGHVQENGVGRYEIALVYTGLGENEEAFKWLEEAYKARDVGFVYLKIDPCLDPLRSDPRFEDLLQRVGLAK